MTTQVHDGDAVTLNPEREALMRLAGLDWCFERGEGVWLLDGEGRRFLDAYAQYGAVALGHNHPAISATIVGALQACVPSMVQPYAAAHAEVLAGELYRLAGGTFSRCVFTTSGAETVEAAIKLVRMRTGRRIIVSASGSYHGKTMAALAASDRLDFARQHLQPAAGFERVPYGDAAALAALLHDIGDGCAGFIVEPVQGEGGVHVPPSGYLAECKALCARHGVAFIADEIQTGLFRTGPAFACHREGVVADVLLVAKALGGGVFPLGACLVNEATWDPAFALAHSSTFANNNLACAVGFTVLRELQSPAFQENLQSVTRKLESGLAALAKRFPSSVTEVRGSGLMRAIALRKPAPVAGYFLNYIHHQGLSAFLFASELARSHGVLVLPTLNDSNVVRIAPPLIAQAEHIEQLLAALEGTLALWESRASDRIARCLLPQATQAPGRGGGKEAGTAPLAFPPHRSPEPPADYAFLIHPTMIEDILLNDPAFSHFGAQELQDYCALCARLPAGVVCEIPPIASARGHSVRGLLIGLPQLPGQMLARGRAEMGRAIAAAVDLASARGAKLVGLGAFTSIYSRKGMAVAGRGPAITTGNLLTAGMTFAGLQAVMAGRGVAFEDLCIGIVGARGSVGGLMAQLVARASPRELVLVGRPDGDVATIGRVATRLAALGSARIFTGRDVAMLERCDVIVSASSSATPVLDGAAIRPGTIICDVARPFDTSPRMRARRDITVIEAGLVSLPGAPMRIGVGNLQGHPPGVALACLSETILLALAGTSRDHGLGDDLDVAEVDAMLDLAQRHGFTLSMHGLSRGGAVDRSGAMAASSPLARRAAAR